MKKFFWGICILLILCGCSGDSQEYEYCANCSEKTSSFLETQSGSVCLDCFKREGYRTCAGCGEYYLPGVNRGSEIYCNYCVLDYIWECAICTETYPLAALMPIDDVGNYYICAHCENIYMGYFFDALDEVVDDVDYNSREIFLGLILDEVSESAIPRDALSEIVG